MKSALFMVLLSAASLAAGDDGLETAEPPPAAGVEGARSRPNIVLMLADDLAWGDLGCYGHPFHRTPHVDRLAREGLRCTAAYANAPNCAPTRAALMSGQYPPRTGIYTVGKAAHGDPSRRRLIPVPNRRVLDGEVWTLAEALSAAGYATASVGKWHLGPDPSTQGFDLNVAGGPRGHPTSCFSPYEMDHLSDGPEGEYLTDRLASEAVRFIRDHREEPLFLYLPFYSVHTPIEGRPDLVQRYQVLRIRCQATSTRFPGKAGKTGRSCLAPYHSSFENKKSPPSAWL